MLPVAEIIFHLMALFFLVSRSLNFPEFKEGIIFPSKGLKLFPSEKQVKKTTSCGPKISIPNGKLELLKFVNSESFMLEEDVEVLFNSLVVRVFQ